MNGFWKFFFAVLPLSRRTRWHSQIGTATIFCGRRLLYMAYFFHQNRVGNFERDLPKKRNENRTKIGNFPVAKIVSWSPGTSIRYPRSSYTIKLLWMCFLHGRSGMIRFHSPREDKKNLHPSRLRLSGWKFFSSSLGLWNLIMPSRPCRKHTCSFNTLGKSWKIPFFMRPFRPTSHHYYEQKMASKWPLISFFPQAEARQPRPSRLPSRCM